MAGLLAGGSLVTVDFFAVLAALPLLQHQLGASPGQLQLVVAGYAIVTACTMVIGGRLGDAWGRRRVLLAGLALFALGALGAALAHTAAAIVSLRLVQGLGGALAQPQVLALMTLNADPAQRTRVFGAYTATLAMAAVSAQLVAGALVQWLPPEFAWRGSFLLTLPLCAAAALLTRGVVDGPRDATPRVDLVGALLLAGALGAWSAALTLGRDQGWPAWTALAGAGGAACLMLSVAWQRRGARLAAAGRPTPRLLPAGLLGANHFTRAVAGLTLFYAGVSSFYLVFALSLRATGLFTPAAVGMVFGLVAVAAAVASMSPRVRLAVGERWAGAGTLLLGTGHLAWLAAVHAGDEMATVAGVLAGALMQGAGIGLLMARLMSHATSLLSAQQTSVGSGVATTMQQVGNSLGVVLIGLAYFDDGGTGRDLPAAVAYLLATLGGLWLLVGGAARRGAASVSPAR